MQFGDVSLKTDLCKQRSDCCSKAAGTIVVLLDCVAQNLADLFFHTSPALGCAPLQLSLYVGLDVPHKELGHTHLGHK